MVMSAVMSILESYAEVDLEIPHTSYCSAALYPAMKNGKYVNQHDALHY